MHELHDAARGGSVERTVAVLSKGLTDIINKGDSDGFTPLVLSAQT